MGMYECHLLVTISENVLCYPSKQWFGEKIRVK